MISDDNWTDIIRYLGIRELQTMLFVSKSRNSDVQSLIKELSIVKAILVGDICLLHFDDYEDRPNYGVMMKCSYLSYDIYSSEHNKYIIIDNWGTLHEISSTDELIHNNGPTSKNRYVFKDDTSHLIGLKYYREDNEDIEIVTLKYSYSVFDAIFGVE